MLKRVHPLASLFCAFAVLMAHSVHAQKSPEDIHNLIRGTVEYGMGYTEQIDHLKKIFHLSDQASDQEVLDAVIRASHKEPTPELRFKLVARLMNLHEFKQKGTGGTKLKKWVKRGAAVCALLLIGISVTVSLRWRKKEKSGSETQKPHKNAVLVRSDACSVNPVQSCENAESTGFSGVVEVSSPLPEVSGQGLVGETAGQTMGNGRADAGGTAGQTVGTPGEMSLQQGVVANPEVASGQGRDAESDDQSLIGVSYDEGCDDDSDEIIREEVLPQESVGNNGGGAGQAVGNGRADAGETAGQTVGTPRETTSQTRIRRCRKKYDAPIDVPAPSRDHVPTPEERQAIDRLRANAEYEQRTSAHAVLWKYRSTVASVLASRVLPGVTSKVMGWMPSLAGMASQSQAQGAGQGAGSFSLEQECSLYASPEEAANAFREALRHKRK